MFHLYIFFKHNYLLLPSLKEAEKPYCERLHRIKDLMQRSNVSIEEVISELGQHLFVVISNVMQDFYCL